MNLVVSWIIRAFVIRVVVLNIAGMAELVDALDSKSSEGNFMGVRFPLPAPSNFLPNLYRTLLLRPPRKKTNATLCTFPYVFPLSLQIPGLIWYLSGHLLLSHTFLK